MKKIAFIPSRENTPPPTLAAFLERAGWSVCLLPKYDSIFDAFSNGVKLHNIIASDKIIMCHDDITILTSKKYFNEFLDEKLDKKDTGFVGVAGTKFFKHAGVWWEDMNLPPGPMNPLTGFVMHGNTDNISSTFYGAYGESAVLDGLFLATTGKVLNTISLKKPSFFEGNWDFYDIFYTGQAHLKKLKNYTVPIQIVHKSPGIPKDGWHKNREAFIRHFNDKLPFCIR